MSDPMLHRLPSVSGSSLSREKVRFPEDLAGKPAVLLVAYRQGTQQDVDRWLEFLSGNWPQIRCYEVPTIAGLLWRPLSGWIDSGMRGGVPRNKWSSVVTLYGEDATTLRSFLGDPGGYSACVAVLNKESFVAWFHAAGYSDDKARELSDVLKRLIE